ncbi:transporter suffix domain-containing protein [Flammeovirga pacifica]|uniref:Transporter suffix domain-containing protein n=1 Tax=Flammeovirga pacifica TaxID=915059 RepID=A0A1S1Z0J1_FLAPC|nr:transporter suffix domain-containing protein [Flammeovirga pacifica]OHX66771.1 hypothetical protein NH26_10590 [Flammeovirga pacifica]
MKTSLKSKIGITFVVLGFISPVFGLIVPFLGFNTTITTSLITFFLVGGPEVFLLLGSFLAGKEGVKLVKGKVKKLFGLPEEDYAANSSQYRIGVICILLWLFLIIFPGYVPHFFEMPLVRENLFYLSIGTDLLLILGVFVFGGNQMVTKISEIVRWEPWKLPEKKVKN